MKDELRYKLKIKRKYFHEIRRGYADELIKERFFEEYGNFESYFIYKSFNYEATTDLIIDTLLILGKKIYLPRVEGDNIVPVPYGKLTRGAFGIEEPEGQAFDGKIDVTVTPLLAVNERGFRLGYGKGYYDRYFRTENGKDTLKIGLGYSFQKEQFVEDGWDEPLNAFISEDGIVKF